MVKNRLNTAAISETIDRDAAIFGSELDDSLQMETKLEKLKRLTINATQAPDG